jgi:hypothetical protein
VSDPDRVNVARRMDTRSVRFATLAMTVLALSVALPSSASAKPNWLVEARILVASNPVNHNCRTGVCQHNENTDLTRWHGAIYLVHRPDALLRRPYVVGDARNRPSRMGVLAGGQARRRVLLDGI